jgi:hypothetical protein|tara:strand:- start:2936 stop:3100 length:165 start_codon:yes stop_codon:yes gene_type:complete
MDHLIVFANDWVDAKTNKIAIKNFNKFLDFISPPNYLIQKSSLIIRETKEKLLH